MLTLLLGCRFMRDSPVRLTNDVVEELRAVRDLLIKGGSRLLPQRPPFDALAAKAPTLSVVVYAALLLLREELDRRRAALARKEKNT